MKTLSGIGKLDRERLAAIRRGTKYTIAVSEAAKILNMPRSQAAKLLARSAEKGWLSRIRHGVYIPISLESPSVNVPLDDPWIVAENLYNPCYIGAWSAAEHWGLTEQVYRTVVVFTTRKPRNRKPEMNGTNFLLMTVSQQAIFGLSTIWREKSKVHVSDPSRTILDLLAAPKLGGGIRPAIDIFNEYLSSKYCNLKLLIDYAKQLNNKAVFKRLGYLLEQYAPDELEIITACKNQVTVSKAKLDPQLGADILVTRWRLWIPKNWKK